jgi:long-chain acyl-CoA synthetase
MGASLLKNIVYNSYVGEPKEGETGILRNPFTKPGKLKDSNHIGCQTLYDSFSINLKNGKDKDDFLGYRKKIKKDELEKKYSWITYEDAHDYMINFVRGLNVLNLCPEIKIENEGSYRFLGIYSKNNKEWLFSMYGAARDSITIVTIYDTLGQKAIEYILEQTQLTTIVIEVKALKRIHEIIKNNKISNVKNLIVIEKEDDEDTAKNLENCGLNVYSWEEVYEKGKNEGQNMIFKMPTPEDIALINYTSGTTGSPKGAKITHHNILSNCDIFDVIGICPRGGDIYYSFLPYAHIMELFIINLVINHGIKFGICNGNVAKLQEDLEILKPHGLCAVPRVFQKIYDTINMELNKKPPLVRRIFQKALDIKIKDYKETGLLDNILLDRLIFKKIRDKFGGKLFFMLVGSAPVEPKILDFLRCTLSCEIVEGYGQTEDVAAVLLTRTFDPVVQHLGGPGNSCEIKLVDIPDLGYTSQNIDEKTGKRRPAGEICVRGTIVFKGYFRDEIKTKEVLDDDGWLHSGDIGELIPEHGNALRIVDRVKNIFKLQQGEYISPEKIENIFLGSKYIEQIFIYGESVQSYLIAIIYPKSFDVIEFMKKKINDINKDNYINYLDDEELKKEIIKELDVYGRKNDLKGFELPKKIFLTKEPFSVENQIVTPTLKIRRHNAKKYFMEEIKKLYEI